MMKRYTKQEALLMRKLSLILSHNNYHIAVIAQKEANEAKEDKEGA